MLTNAKHTRRWGIGGIVRTRVSIVEGTVLDTLPKALSLETHRDGHFDLMTRGQVHLGGVQTSDTVRAACSDLLTHIYNDTTSCVPNIALRRITSKSFDIVLYYKSPVTKGKARECASIAKAHLRRLNTSLNGT